MRARSIFSLFNKHSIVQTYRPPSFRISCCIRMASTLPKLPIFEALKSHDPKSTAIVHYPSGRNFTYGELIHDIADAAESLKGKAEGQALPGERIAFLVENGYDYVGAQLVHVSFAMQTC
jgi:malonyl-CoA/methylmalonyl-CoA synthetase